MIEFYGANGTVGFVAIRDGELVGNIAVQSVAQTWINARRPVDEFETAYDGWSNGTSSGRRIPDDAVMIDTLDVVTLSIEAFHLPGRHNQNSHGRRGTPGDLGRVGGGLKAGKAIKVTHGLIHKKHADNTTIAITKNGDKKVTWNGKAYNLESKSAGGGWKTEKTAIKSKAYVEVNAFASDWHEPEGGKPEPGAPTPAAPGVPKPKPSVTAPTAPTPPAAQKKNGPGTTVHNDDVPTYGLKAGEPIHLTSSMFNKTYKQGTIIAVNKDASKKITSYGSYYELQEKDSAGKWGWGNSVLKPKALDEANKFDKNWFAPVLETEKPGVSSSSPSPSPSPPSPSSGDPANKLNSVSMNKDAFPNKPITLTQDMFNENYPPNAILATTASGTYQIIHQNGVFKVRNKDYSGKWNTVSESDKNGALKMATDLTSNWYSVLDPGGVATAPPLPAAPSTPSTPTAPPGPKNFTPLQKAKVTGIFAKNGVKWHTDTKKIYDSALEVSKAHPDMSMADALQIMDGSLQKKTGDPFTTKMTKFLSTKAGMKYAQDKGYSAPVGGTTQSVTPSAGSSTGGYVQPGSTVPGVLPIDNGPYKKLTKPDASAMQKKMNEISPPPWTGAQKASLKYYTGSAYTAINKCLRGTGDCTPTLLAHIKDIKAGMKPSTQNIMVYRKTAAITLGLSSAADAKKLIGTTIKDDGAISTSISDGKWSGQIHMRIQAPVGSKMAWVAPISHYPTENEVLLAPGTEFEVIAVEQGWADTQIMVVRVVPGSGS